MRVRKIVTTEIFPTIIPQHDKKINQDSEGGEMVKKYKGKTNNKKGKH